MVRHDQCSRPRCHPASLATTAPRRGTAPHHGETPKRRTHNLAGVCGSAHRGPIHPGNRPVSPYVLCTPKATGAGALSPMRSCPYCHSAATRTGVPSTVSDCFERRHELREDVWEGSRWFRDLPHPEPPPGLRERVMAEVAAYERQRCIRRTVRRISGIAITILLGLLIAIGIERRLHQCNGTMPDGGTHRRRRNTQAMSHRAHRGQPRTVPSPHPMTR